MLLGWVRKIFVFLESKAGTRPRNISTEKWVTQCGLQSWFAVPQTESYPEIWSYFAWHFNSFHFGLIEIKACIRKNSVIKNKCMCNFQSFASIRIYILYTYIFWMPNSYIFSQWCYGVFMFIFIVRWGNKGSERLTYWSKITQTVTEALVLISDLSESQASVLYLLASTLLLDPPFCLVLPRNHRAEHKM